ncbi:hypothetical protein IMZ48_22305, partial [Candidatus Bathyarchaeota archaeon]|nr:hypothetical protein [Candidatus Bathyarchaeota archaeon]
MLRNLASRAGGRLMSASNPSWRAVSGRRTFLTTQARYNNTPATNAPPSSSDSFLSGSAAGYIDEMYIQWKEDPTSVHISWQVYFKNMESGDMPIAQAFQPPPNLVPSGTGGVPLTPGAGIHPSDGGDVMNHLKVQLLCRAYQAR